MQVAQVTNTERRVLYYIGKGFSRQKIKDLLKITSLKLCNILNHLESLDFFHNPMDIRSSDWKIRLNHSVYEKYKEEVIMAKTTQPAISVYKSAIKDVNKALELETPIDENVKSKASAEKQLRTVDYLEEDKSALKPATVKLLESLATSEWKPAWMSDEDVKSEEVPAEEPKEEKSSGKGKGKTKNTPPAPRKRDNSKTRYSACVKAYKDGMTMEELGEAANKITVEWGQKDNVKQSIRIADRVLQVIEAAKLHKVKL